MKILMLSDSNSSHTLKWVESLSKVGVEILLFSMYNNVEKGIQTLADDESIQLSLGEEGYTGSILDFKFYRRAKALRKTIKEFRPDVLHAHYASSYGLLGATAGFSPYFISVWGSDIFSFPRRKWAFKQILKFNLSKATAIYSSSEVMATETKRYTSSPVEVIPFGVNSEHLAPTNRQKRKTITIGTIKRLEHIYGIDTLIRAFAEVCRMHPDLDLKLSIVGEGILLNELMDLAKSLGIYNSCTFHGKVPHAEIKNHLDELDVFVALSREESFGVAILEAMSCELPVVVSDAPGPQEIVSHKNDGFIVEKEDYQTASVQLSKLITNAALRLEMGKKGRRKVLEKYDWNLNVQQMLKAYSSYLGAE